MNEYGLPLTAPSKQTILPVVKQSDGMIMGFYAIAETTFTGSETSFTLSDGTVPLLSVTVDALNQTNTQDADEARVPQFMAAVWPIDNEYQLPWRGYASFIDPSLPNNIGYYAWWSMPTVLWMKHFSLGTWLTSMKYGLAQYDIVAPTPGGNPPVTTPQSLEWSTSIDLAAFGPNCTYSDFNWIELFQAQLATDPSVEGVAVVPQSIMTTSNPAGGALKASVVQGVSGSAGPTIYPGGGVVFNTVRILKLLDVVPGTYTFTFQVSALVSGQVKTSTATLNLTVV
jgi:hypothetical protein